MTFYRPFPKLPAKSIAALEPIEQYTDELGARPETWDQLQVEDLDRLFRYQLLLAGLSRDLNRVGPLRDLYGVAQRRLSSDVRLQIVLWVSDFYESACRRGEDIHDIAFFEPFLLEDKDAQVVSTAALQAASLLGDRADDMAGRRCVLELASNLTDDNRKAMIVGGLMSLGDSQTMTLLDGVWKSLPKAAQKQLLHLIYSLPWAGVAEFILAWAEEAVALGREEELAAALGALSGFAQARRCDGVRMYAGWPVQRIRRSIPAWAYPPDRIVVVEQTWSIDEFARYIEPRLRAIAACERDEPKVTPMVLQVWRLTDNHTSAIR